MRLATEGEQVLTLDKQWRVMTARDLLITDPAGPAAIAGVMGGADTEMTWKTKKVLLESAHFDSTSIRKTSLRLGLSSEASYRFERIVDPAGTLRALARVAGLTRLPAAGSGHAVDACAREFAPSVPLRPEVQCGPRYRHRRASSMRPRLEVEDQRGYLHSCGADLPARCRAGDRPDREVAIVTGTEIPTTVRQADAERQVRRPALRAPGCRRCARPGSMRPSPTQ